MKEILCVLAVLRVATGNSIITRNMLYGLDDDMFEPVPLQTPVEAGSGEVTEKNIRVIAAPDESSKTSGYANEEHSAGRNSTKDERIPDDRRAAWPRVESEHSKGTSRIRKTPIELLSSLGYLATEDTTTYHNFPQYPTETERDIEVVTEKSVRIRKTPRELLRSLGYIEEEEQDQVEGRNLSDQETEEESTQSEEDFADFTPFPSTTSAMLPDEATNRIPVAIIRRKTDSDEQEAEPLSNISVPHNRTKLFPVGRLWERTVPPRPMPGLMAVLDAAFSCIWSGLGFECFSLKVVPMFRAMMGFPPMHPFGHPYFVLPRTETEPAANVMEENTIGDQGRRRRRPLGGLRLGLKTAMIGLAAAKTLLLPALSALSLVSGKAIIVGVGAIALSLAVAWSGARSADRRVYTTSQQDNQHAPYNSYEYYDRS